MSLDGAALIGGFISNDFLFNKMLVSKRINAFDNAVRKNAEKNYVYNDGIIKAILTNTPIGAKARRGGIGKEAQKL